MKVEVGEYIRTKQGTIGKAIEKYEKYCVISNTRGEIDVPYENIVKHSKNILDLVEVGDYLDGVRVSETYINNIKYLAKDYNNKTIVTKEQFSNMEYRL